MPRRPPILRHAALAVFLLWACNTGAAQPAVHPYPNTDGFGVAFSKDEDWYGHCMRMVSPPAPRAPGTPGKLRCDATDLYYQKRDQEKTSNAEWRQVRACAEANGNDAVLMMLHANGYGTSRDLDRAIHHACKLDTAKAEMEARVGYLAAPAATDGQAFDLCDHITSGRMGGVCAAIQEGRADRIRGARLERLAASLPAPARQPFARLREAAEAFTRKSTDEVDMSGSGAAGFTFRHAGRRDEEFMETLLKAAGGKLPRASASELAQLDRQLNREYQKVMATPSEQDTHPQRIHYLTVERADVRSTERVWLAYRDAWEPFIAAAGWRTDFTSIKAALTRQRIAQLKRIQK
ncbi:lysozyme inhibitor LprI family protein [Massilia sp. CMS3.1]|uniref:lysozyme inhibitor LprI family protein n=1 Tax=Massilia sp. CMS3.1 TaxID=3373083 RepID=UPI003EE54DFC